MNTTKTDPLKEKRNELISRRRNLLQIRKSKGEHLVTGFLHEVKIKGKKINLVLKGVVRSPKEEEVDPDLYKVFLERGLVKQDLYTSSLKRNDAYKFFD